MILDLSDILAALPHRPPMLMIDHARSLASRDELLAFRHVAPNDPILQGHFPGHPVLPGVLLVEAIAQAAGLLVASTGELAGAGGLPYLVGIDQARFRKPVLPSQDLEIHVLRTKTWGPFSKFTGTVRIAGEVVAEASLMATLAPVHAQEQPC